MTIPIKTPLKIGVTSKFLKVVEVRTEVFLSLVLDSDVNHNQCFRFERNNVK